MHKVFKVSSYQKLTFQLNMNIQKNLTKKYNVSTIVSTDSNTKYTQNKTKDGIEKW